MEGRFFCGLPEALQTADLRRAPQALWWLGGDLASVDHAGLRHAIQQAFDAWSAVAACAAQEAASPAEAHLLISVVAIDGPQGVLADCELPGPQLQHLRLDARERWVVHLGADVAAQDVDVVRVLTHELGHFWGLGHAPQGSPNLMAPTYSRSVWAPREQWDVPQMQGLYGPPAAPPPAQDVPAEIWIKGRSGQWLAAYQLGGRIA